MNKNIFRLALTGGPCAGKTTALARIIEKFSSLGYLVYALPETPTLFSNASINFLTADRQYFYNIEKAVLKYQIQMEDTFIELARSAERPVLIISDRGTMDISAYMEATIWQALLDELGLNEVKLRDARYDAVIHMVTAAIGAEEFYTTENNSARSEGLELARDLDSKIMKAWTGHPHFRIVENNVDFDIKIQQTIRAIREAIGEETSITTENRRRFLVNVVGEIPYGVEADIYQTYIDNEDGTTTRIRKRGLRGNYVYFISSKKTFKGKSKTIITERQINPDEYLNYLNRATTARNEIVHKMRKSFIWAKQYFELDTFIEPHNNLQLLEVNSISDLSPKFPTFIEVIEEVTNNPKYERL